MPISPPGYVWDPRMAGGRYRVIAPNGNPGRIVSPATITASLRSMHDVSAARFSALAKGMVNGHLSPATFQLAMMKEMKNLHTSMAALGAGGWNQATHSTWGKVGNTLRNEYRALARFTREIEAGKLSEEQIAQRAALYADNAYGEFWTSWTKTQRNGGMTRERLIPQAGACHTCTDKASEGWVSIGKHIIPVHNRCRCSKEYQ